MTVSILGTSYTIKYVKYDEEEAFARRNIDGFCNVCTKEIVLCDMHTYKGWEHEDDQTVLAAEKQTLRHEIVHAFFGESGLVQNCLQYDGSWPENEELVDWLAWQGPKLYEAWKEAGAL